MSGQTTFTCLQNYPQFQLPLGEDSVDYRFEVIGPLACHSLSLQYTIPPVIQEKSSLSFSFSLSDDACFESLQVINGEEVIHCEIKEKTEAIEEFKEATKQNKKAAIGNLSSGRGQFQLEVSNTKPGDQIRAEFKFIEQIQLNLNNSLQFHLPIPLHLHKLTIKGDIKTQHSRDSIKSIFLNGVFDTHPYDKAFNAYFVISFEEYNVSLLSQYNDDSDSQLYCGIYHFQPPQKRFQKANKDLIKAEYILIVDRSGSMSGDKMEMAKDSLKFFLKSLPEGSLYNVISFGTNYSFLYEKSNYYSDGKIQETLLKIDDFQANYGGTFIVNPLKLLFTFLPDHFGMKKKIFIITDGEFSDLNEAIQLAKDNANRCNINILGIGREVNLNQIEQITKPTNGISKIVKSHSSVIESVISLLQQSCANDHKVSLSLQSSNFDCIEQVVPDPALINVLNQDKTFRFFVFFNKQLQTTKKLQLNLVANIENYKTIETKYEVDIDDSVKHQIAPVHKMGLLTLIKQVELGRERNAQLIPDDDASLAEQKKQQIDPDILRQKAIRHQILCEYTSFVGVSNLENTRQHVKDIKDNSILNQKVEEQSNNIKLSYVNLSQGAKYSKKSAGCCDAGGGGSYSSSSYREYNQQPNNSKGKVQGQGLYKDVTLTQRVNGSWLYDDAILKQFNISAEDFDQQNPLKDVMDLTSDEKNEIWMTLILVYWLQTYRQKQANIHMYILLKAYKFIDRLAKEFSELKSIPPKIYSDLFKNYVHKDD